MSRHLFTITTPTGFRYDVEEADIISTRYGECINTYRRTRRGRVRIGAGQPPSERLDTVLHEMLHAIKPRWKEGEIKRTAACLARVLWKDGWRRKR